MIDDKASITETKYRMVNVDRDDNSRETREKATMPSELRSISASDWITVAVLCFVNLINYMDRFTVAGESCFMNRLGLIRKLEKFRYLMKYFINVNI